MFFVVQKLIADHAQRKALTEPPGLPFDNQTLCSRELP